MRKCDRRNLRAEPFVHFIQDWRVVAPQHHAAHDRNIFDNLVTRDTKGALVAQVATARRYTDDKTVVFDICTDITFHDGSKLTPDDVAFSVTRIIDPAFKTPQLSQYDQITSAEVTGPAQVTLRTRSPYPVLLAQLVKLSIVPKAIVQKLGDGEFNQHPIGSGPYTLRSWQHGVATTLEAMPNYWRGAPPFATVVFRAVPDVTTRVADLRAGRADLARGLSPDDAEALKSKRSVQLLTIPPERVAYLSINAFAGPAKDVRVRRAIALVEEPAWRQVGASAVACHFAEEVSPPLAQDLQSSLRSSPSRPSLCRSPGPSSRSTTSASSTAARTARWR